MNPEISLVKQAYVPCTVKIFDVPNQQLFLQLLKLAFTMLMIIMTYWTVR